MQYFPLQLQAAQIPRTKVSNQNRLKYDLTATKTNINADCHAVIWIWIFMSRSHSLTSFSRFQLAFRYCFHI